MKAIELLPNDKNIIDSLTSNTFGRNADVIKLMQLLEAQEGMNSIAIDGNWGSGKTFFVRQLQKLINCSNENYTNNGNTDSIKNILSDYEYECRENMMCLYYDAWENDNDIDPVISIVYQLVQQLNMDYSLSNGANIFKFAVSVIEQFTSINFNNIIDSLKSEDPLEQIEKEKDLHTEIENLFFEIINERCNRLIIVIDELDRCKPTYAVNLLERIKHYFNDERITFVFAVNIKELQHTIKRYYGDNFDGCRYLDRFFDLRITLPPAKLDTFISNVGINTNETLKTVSKKLIEMCQMELREITKYYQQLKTAVSSISEESFLFRESRGRLFILLFVVPILCALKITNQDEYDDFINGKNPRMLVELLSDDDIGKRIREELINRDESFEYNSDSKMVTEKEVYERIYSAIFVEQYDYKHDTNYGKYSFSRESKEFAIKASSMLTHYADYQI